MFSYSVVRLTCDLCYRYKHAMIDLAFDWLLLYLQIFLLGAMIIPQLLRRKNRNLYAVLIAGTMLVLVQGQIWWMFNLFEQGHTQITHILQYIVIDAAQRANWYVTLCVICMYTVFTFLTAITPKNLVGDGHGLPLIVSTRESGFSLALVFVWVSLVTFLLVRLRGGLVGLVMQPGASVPGQTLFLIALGVGKIPFLRRLAAGLRLRLLDVGLLAVVFTLILLNSRFLSAFILLQTIFTYNYCRYEIKRRYLILTTVVLIAIFFGYGLYREYLNFYTTINTANIVEFFSIRLSGSDILGWFYAKNVEGFAGLAGILTYEQKNNGLNHDFGISTLSFFTQLLPNAVRTNPNLFKPLADYLEAFYPYNGSIVASGLENAYAHFGVLGIGGLGILLGCLTHWLHIQMRYPRTDKLQIAILSIHILDLIRGPFRNVLFFGLADLAILWLYRVLLSLGKNVRLTISKRSVEDGPVITPNSRLD